MAANPRVPILVPEKILIHPRRNEILEMYHRNLRHIMTRYNRGRLVESYIYMTQAENLPSDSRMTRDIFGHQSFIFQLQLSFSSIMENETTGELRFFHSSYNNFHALERPRRITNINDWENLLSELADMDFYQILNNFRESR